jgi:ribosomal protein S12 methylthiotransferase accessory factor YcaO
LNALLECIERDAMALWWHGETQRPALPLELIDAQQPRLFWWLQKRMRKTLLLDLTQDSGVPVVAAVSGEDDGKWVAVGTAAKLTVDAAALSAVSEMIQTEIAMSQALAAKDPGIADWSDHASMRGMTQFQPLPMAEAPRKPHEGLKSVLAGLAASHHRAHVVDLTLQGDLLHTVRVVAPGLCAMQGRINSERFRSVTGRDFDFQKLAHEKRLEPF